MKRSFFVGICAVCATVLSLGCSSGDKKGVSAGPGGGGPLSGPFMGALFSGGRSTGKMSGNLLSDGTMDITMLSAPFPQMQTKVASDGTFSQDTTVQGYAIHYEGKVELQPGAQHKFIISGTFTSNGSNGTFVLRSLDWQVLDGVKPQMGAGGNGVPPRIAFASETLGFASWSATMEPMGSALPSSFIWRTDDGGSTWNPAGTVSGAATSMRYAAGKLWVATDTGLWSSQDQGVSFASAVLRSFDSSDDYYGTGSGSQLMDFLDASHGVLLNLNTGKVRVTLDGGKTWTASSLLTEPGSGFGDSGSVQMLSPTEAVALVPSIGGYNPALFRTTDGGLSWKTINPAVTPTMSTSPDAQGANCGNGRTSDVRFLDSSRGWAFAGQCLATTQDGGVTWTWSGSYVSCGPNGRLLAATATRVFVGCEYGRPKVTTDGGANFRDIPEITDSVASMKVLPDGSGLLASGNTLYATNDGGATWTALPTSTIGTTGLVPVSGTEWWTWTSLGLEHVSQVGAARELVLVAARITELQTTNDALWAGLDPSTWLAIPLTGGAPQAVSAPGRMWPLSRTTLVAEIQSTFDHPELQLGLGLSSDGGQTWKNIVGLPSNLWTVCAADATHAWIVAGNGSFFLLENGIAQLAYTDPSGHVAEQALFCDASRFWFLDNGTPKLISGGVLTEQAVPMEWKSSKVSALVNSETLASAVSESAAWLALSDGRILRFMNDAAYAATPGPAMLGTAPVSSGLGGTPGTSENRPPVLGEISSVAHYTYDINGNYMGGTIQLSTTASDPDGDKVTISWTLNPSSGGPSLTSTTGNTNILILDSFASGGVVVTASDGKGGSDTRTFSFGRPAGSH